MNKSVTSCISLFKQSQLFSGIDESGLKQIADRAFPIHLRENEIIVREGDNPHALYIIQEGRIKVFKDSLSGKEFIIAIRRIGETFSETAVIESLPCFASCQAIEETLVMALKREAFLILLNQYPVIALNAMHIMGIRIRNLYKKLLSLVADTADQRLADTLLMLSSEYGATLSFNRKDIAEMIGTTPETSTRILSALKNLDIISSNQGRITIRDTEKLKTISNLPL